MAVIYPANPYPRAHPDRMNVVAQLYGVDAQDVESATILELGCGTGGHLIPMAQRLPNAQFIGLDIDQGSIQAAEAKSDSLELKNIQWLCCSVKDYSAPSTDYIIAHGLYSWVPDEVRTAVWGLIQKSLKPNGVAFLSHVSLPGGHLRAFARDIMMSSHVVGMTEKETVLAGVETLKSVAQFHSQSSHYGQLLNKQVEEIETQDWHYLWHDYFVSGYKAFYLEEMLSSAKDVGLQYLHDADLKCNLPFGLPLEQVKVVQEMDQLSTAGQYIDAFLGRNFRRSLWVSKSQTLKLDLSKMDSFYLRPHFQRSESEKGVLLNTNDGQQLGFRGELAKDLTQKMLGYPEQPISKLLGDHPDQTREWIFSLFCAGALSFSSRKRFSQYIPELRQVKGTDRIVNCFHEPIELSFFEASILRALDEGHRGLELVQALVLSAEENAFKVKIDNRETASREELFKILTSILPGHCEKMWMKGILPSPQIFESV